MIAQVSNCSSSSNTDTQLSTINLAPELLQRIDDIIDKLTNRFNEAAKTTCFCGRQLTIDEYDKAIDDTTQALLTGHEQSELFEKELYYFKRDRQRNEIFINMTLSLIVLRGCLTLVSFELYNLLLLLG